MAKEKSSIVRKAYFDKPTEFIDIGSLVKNLDAKKQKTSVFIGSSSESHHIAGFVKAELDQFKDEKGETKYEVDTWKMNIFGGKDKKGKELTIAEQLKNFTDIYDFAIFLFVPDENISSNTRVIAGTRRILKSQGVKHNVIFEFGLFLGRLGAKRSIVLYEKGVKDFIDLCFTDLKDDFTEIENPNQISKSFKLELLEFSGEYSHYVKDGNKNLSFDKTDLLKKVKQIEDKIASYQNQVSVGFLPSTTLAVGYFNNFLNRVQATFENILLGESLEVDDYKPPLNITEIVKNKTEIVFKILIPNNLKELQYHNFDDILKLEGIKNVKIKPKDNAREITMYCNAKDLSDGKLLRLYDFPTTLNSSIEAILEINEHQDIQELLSEKEKRNFIQAISQIVAKSGTEIISDERTFRFELMDIDKLKMEID